MRPTRRQTFLSLLPVCLGGSDLPGHMALNNTREEGSSRAQSQATASSYVLLVNDALPPLSCTAVTRQSSFFPRPITVSR